MYRCSENITALSHEISEAELALKLNNYPHGKYYTKNRNKSKIEKPK
uniref:Uncharacterized protein n=1 Tax=Lupinus angustifolius TaxID=3871 RepID=L0P104_LUPAN|nr:hypothetical protein [Lupinus angustifolius]